MDLDSFWTMFMLTITYDVELLVCRGFVRFGRNLFSNVLIMMTTYFELRYRAAILALAADDTTLQTIVDTTCTAPFFIMCWYCFGFFVNKSVHLIKCDIFYWTSKKHHCGL